MAPDEQEPITVESDVVIPDYRPLDVPYSQRRRHQGQELLEANGFGDTAAEWRRAAGHANDLIRETAYYLLTRQPQQRDTDLFRQGLADDDDAVQALSAYGLALLGDPSTLPQIREIARSDVAANLSAALAAGILGQLGDPAAFSTICQALDSDLDYVRLFALRNALPFAALHGREYEPGKQIDIWAFYRQALADQNEQVRRLAILQLSELNTPESQALLQHP